MLKYCYTEIPTVILPGNKPNRNLNTYAQIYFKFEEQVQSCDIIIFYKQWQIKSDFLFVFLSCWEMINKTATPRCLRTVASNRLACQ